MKRVLEVFGEPISRGGQESYVLSALQNMSLSGLHVDVFTPYYCENQGYFDYFKSIGGSVFHADLPFIVGGTRREIVPCFVSFLNNHDKYDIVHIHSGSISVLAYYSRVASRNGIKKVIVHSHSSGSKETIKHFLIKRYASTIFKRYATDYCACSLEAAEWKFPKKILDKTKILKNGVDVDQFRFDSQKRNQIRNVLGINEETLVLGHVGRFTREKNQVFLVDLLKKYLILNPEQNVCLVLVGDGDELENVKRRAGYLNIDKFIKFIGASDIVPMYMQAFDIFLFPSLYEGLGIVGIEAQASGLPVIASKGIPVFMKVTSNVEFLSLGDIDIWCRKINEYKNKKREDTSEDIKQKGFELKETSKLIQKLYLDE